MPGSLASTTGRSCLQLVVAGPAVEEGPRPWRALQLGDFAVANHHAIIALRGLERHKPVEKVFENQLGLPFEWIAPAAATGGAQTQQGACRQRHVVIHAG